MSDSDGRRGIGQQLLTFLIVTALVASAVGPALAATPQSTWDGEVSLSGTPTDGTSYQYDVTNLDSVSNLTLNLTGVTSTEWDNVSATAAGDGDTFALDVAGNVDPTGPASGDPQVTFAAGDAPVYNPLTDEGDGSTDADRYIVGDDGNGNAIKSGIMSQPNQNRTVRELRPYIGAADGDGYSASVDIYISEGKPDTTWQEGTLVKSDWQPSWSSGEKSVPLDSSIDLTGGTNYTVEFVTANADGDGSTDYLNLAFDWDGSTTSTYTRSAGTTTLDGYWGDIQLVSQEVTDPGIDVDGDGTLEASYSGALSSGESVTRTLSNLSVSDDTATVSATSGAADIDVEFKERTQTVDPGVGLNTKDGGGWMNYSSTLAEGETVSLVTNKSWVQSGTNVVDVQLGDGSLSADAPTPKVKLNYSHRAASTQSVTVDGEVWSERWNTSRTWASDRDDATLSIPFADSVVATRAVTVYSNGSEVGATSTNFDGTTLNVGLGNVEDGETTRVVANGSKVRTVNGSIAVTEPTPVGQQLDTEFRVDERSDGFRIDVGATTKDEWLHYASGESWSDPAEFARFDTSGGQSLYLPNAPAGGTARVSTLAVDVDTSQNVDIGVAQPGSLVFDVAPGPTTGDDVTFNYVGATSGTEYELVSVDRDDYRLSRDSGSTAILKADDSEETLQIRPINSSTGTTQLQDVGDSGGGIPPAVDPRANPYALLTLSGIVIMGGVGVAAWRPSIPMWAVIPLLVPVTLVVIATQSPGTLRQLVAGKFGTAIEQVGPALLLLGGTVGSYVIYKLAQKLGPDKKVFKFGGGGKK